MTFMESEIRSGSQAVEGKTRADDRGGEALGRPDHRSGGGLSDSEVFDVLRNSRRRAALSYLLEGRREASIRELTEHVASEEYGVAAGEVSADQYKRVYTALCQCHLPRLDEFGVVAFDEKTKTVSLRETAQVERYLQPKDHRTAVRTELTAAVAVASLVTLGVSGVGPLGGVSVLSWTVLTVLALFGVAALQLHMADLL
jgi:hypothetical protein